MRGFVRIKAWKRGRLLWELERENTIVTASLPLIAKLVAGVYAGNFISVVGFGSGAPADPPPATDSDLTATPAYYNDVGAVSYPTPGQVQFPWTIDTTGPDAAAVGLTISELGFFANTGAVGMPLSRALGAGAPALTMYAHIVWPAFAVAASGIYQGTWTFQA